MSIESAKTDLAYIRQLMEDTRYATGIGGGYFIVWGLVNALGLVGTWVAVSGHQPISLFALWSGCMVVGGLGSALLAWRERRQPVEAPAGKLIGMVWVSMGITTALIFFIGVGSGALAGQQMAGLASALFGGAMFLTGGLSSQKWLSFMGFAWWAGAAAMFLWPGNHVLLMMGILLVACYMLPGAVLAKRHSSMTKP